MRAETGHSREQDLDFQGATRLWPLLHTNPQGCPVHTIKLRASRWIILGEQGSGPPPTKIEAPLDLVLIAAVPFAPRTFPKGRVLAATHHGISLPWQRLSSNVSWPERCRSLVSGPPRHRFFLSGDLPLPTWFG